MSRRANLAAMMRPGDISAPSQDQCIIPRYSDQHLWDEVSGDNYGIGSNYSIVETPELALVGTGLDSPPVMDILDSGRPMMTWTGAFTWLTRAYGIASGGNSGSLYGQMGVAPFRGLAYGPNNVGRGAFYFPVDANNIIAVAEDGLFANDGVYHDYAAIYEPSVRISQLKDSALMAEETVGVPAARYINSEYDMSIMNRGDRDTSYFIGRIQFVFWYNRVLSLSEIEAAFANGGYVP